MSSVSAIDSEETVVRILHRDWVVDEELQITAFSLRHNETYISVNRPIIDSFGKDIADFLAKHPDYLIPNKPSAYACAALNVGELRGINVVLGQQTLDVVVEVEPRTTHNKSHAGIFTRLAGANIKGGQQKEIHLDEKTTLPVAAIFQKVQHKLLSLAVLEQQEISPILDNRNRRTRK